MTDRRVPVMAPGVGSHLMYMQIDFGDGENQQVYRQRLLSFEIEAETGRLLQHTYSFINPELYVGAEAGSVIFAQLSTDSLEPMLEQGCEQAWSQVDGHWQAYVDPGQCRIWSERRQDWRHIESSSKLDALSLSVAERGFDDAGEQVFGTPPGEWTRLDRQAVIATVPGYHD
jgi:hypothetical protein